MGTKTGSRIASVILSFILALGFAGCAGGSSAGSSADFVGVWALETMVGEDAPDDEDLEIMKDLGLSIALTLAQDGDAYFDFLGEGLWGTWSYKSENEATLTAEGEKVPLVLADGKLKIEQDGAAMVFAKTDAQVVIPAKDEVEDQDVEDQAEEIDNAAEETGEAEDTGDFVLTEADEEIHAQIGETFGNEYATFTITSVEEDWSGDPSYIIEIRNEWDEPIMVSTAYGTFSVNGKMVDPVLAETIQPGKYTEATMWFSDSDVADLASLVDVEGVIRIMDDDWNTLSEIMVFFPEG